MISLNIQADNITDLTAALRTLGGVITNTEVAQEDASFENIAVEAVERTEAPAVPDVQPEPGVTETSLEPPAPTGEPVVKMEEARAALNELRQKKGAAAVRELLQKHNVQSFIDLSAAEYPTIIKEAKEHE